MFHFKRRTLWIIIYITIPLIIILNRLGPAPEATLQSDDNVPVVSQHSQILWSLDDISIQCSKNSCWLPLADANSIRLSLLLAQVPAAAVAIPAEVEYSTQLLGGFWLGHWQLPAEQASIEALIAMLQNWLPIGAEPVWLLSSADNSLLNRVTNLKPTAQAQGLALAIPTLAAVQRFDVPNIGEVDQLATLMWFEVLKRRLSDEGFNLQWDYRAKQGQVLINRNLSSGAFQAVTNDELQAVVDIYQAAANQRMRDHPAMHRYLVNAAVYQLPFNYFVQQPQRLQQLTVADVNRVREQILGQIQKD